MESKKTRKVNAAKDFPKTNSEMKSNVLNQLKEKYSVEAEEDYQKFLKWKEEENKPITDDEIKEERTRREHTYKVKWWRLLDIEEQLKSEDIKEKDDSKVTGVKSIYEIISDAEDAKRAIREYEDAALEIKDNEKIKITKADLLKWKDEALAGIKSYTYWT